MNSIGMSLAHTLTFLFPASLSCCVLFFIMIGSLFCLQVKEADWYGGTEWEKTLSDFTSLKKLGVF